MNAITLPLRPKTLNQEGLITTIAQQLIAASQRQNSPSITMPTIDISGQQIEDANVPLAISEAFKRAHEGTDTTKLNKQLRIIAVQTEFNDVSLQGLNLGHSDFSQSTHTTGDLRNVVSATAGIFSTSNFSDCRFTLNRYTANLFGAANENTRASFYTNTGTQLHGVKTKPDGSITRQPSIGAYIQNAYMKGTIKKASQHAQQVNHALRTHRAQQQTAQNDLILSL